ncbi:MAG: ribonuclease, partial [Bacteroidales bacterium]|nr:ribonuclease [Bacteroidales bacterium]
MPRKKKSLKKIFVLDTSVILYNHNAINSFDDNDVVIPITVLEELDNFKKGNETKNFEAREFIRIMDRLSAKGTLQDWIPLEFPKAGMFRVQMDEVPLKGMDAVKILGDDKPDHRILNAAIRLSEEKSNYKIILVTKDINLRIKAKALDIPSEDFETGKIKDVDSLYSGKTLLENVNP